MATPPHRPPRTESDYVLSYKKIDSVTTVVREAIKWAGIVLIVRYGYYAIAVLAGHSTFADIVVRFLANVKVSDGILYLLAGGGIVYGVGQRYLRRRHIKHVVPAKNRLEEMLDPNRSSSGLTPQGTTHPGDES
jgi:p-aminobenzoyl-glutamate transporter AbgT